MIDNYDQVPGWPAPDAGVVHRDDSTIFPKLKRQERRLDVLEANRKWQNENREVYLTGARERMRRLRAATKATRVAARAALGSTTRGAKP